MPLAPKHVELSEDDATFVEATRDFARNELLPLDRKWDTGESSIEEILPTLGEMGFLNMVIPEALGGLGCSYRTYAAILHEIGVYSASVAVAISVHSMVGSILARCASDDVRQECLPSWGTGESFAAFALSEAGAGSDAKAATLCARKVDGGYRLDGEKMWISNGLHARWFLTLARLEGADAEASLCAFLVDGRESGLERTKIHGKMGIRGSDLAVVNYTNVSVPDRFLIGAVGDGLEVFLTSLNLGRIGIGVQATGISEACLEEMVSYARQREQFGRPIGSFQAVQNMIAESAVELEASKALIWRAAAEVDGGSPDRVASSMAKLYATEAANRIAYRAVQVHGGTGYVQECRVEQLYRDARVTTIYEGTSEVQRVVIARGLK
ncbi:MAG: acyl-CoA dehydrogenase family protein [Phycisphaerae bacterium]|jgi:alkylation response protein AidB-like acyl-CoA dehydrogenase